MGTKGMITVGISERDFPQSRQVGQTEQSYGYSTDGTAYHNRNVVI